MSAKIGNWCEGANRTVLSEVVPLETPLSIMIEPANACNFHCYYCDFTRKRRLKMHSNTSPIMSLEVFKEIILGMKTFPQKVKAINLSGSGEPLLNPDIVEMVQFAKDMDVCSEIKMITNGSLLTEALGLKLIEAGLDVIRISLQGLDESAYWENSEYKIDFAEFLKNIKNIYDNRKNCKIFIKVIDKMMVGNEGEFYRLFEDKCDELAIEHLIEPMDKIGADRSQNMFGEEVTSVQSICSSPFYSLAIKSDGCVLPCCADVEKGVLGKITNISLRQIWESDRMQSLRINLLESKIDVLCEKCDLPFYSRSSKDNIDEARDRLLKYYRSL